MLSTDPQIFVQSRRGATISRRLHYTQFSDGEMGIIFFGNSMLANALPPRDFAISSRINRLIPDSPGKRPIRAIDLSFGGVSSLSLKQNADRIFRIKPFAVVIQTEVIFPRRAKLKKRSGLVWWSRWTRDRLRAWSIFLKVSLMPSLAVPQKDSKRSKRLLGALSSTTKIDLDLGKKEVISADPFLERAKSFWTNQQISKDTREYLDGTAFIRDAQSRGIRIIILGLPVSETAMRLAGPDYFISRKKAVENLLTPRDIFLQYSNVMKDQYFLDYSHVNENGQKIFYQWLCRALSNELQ